MVTTKKDVDTRLKEIGAELRVMYRENRMPTRKEEKLIEEASKLNLIRMGMLPEKGSKSVRGSKKQVSTTKTATKNRSGKIAKLNIVVNKLKNDRDKIQVELNQILKRVTRINGELGFTQSDDTRRKKLVADRDKVNKKLTVLMNKIAHT